MRPFSAIGLKIILGSALLCYPFLMLLGLNHWGLTPMALVLMLIAIIKLTIDRRSQLQPLYALGILCGVLSMVRQDEVWLKLYPVCMNLGSFIIFAWTLKTEQSMIERFARIREPDLPIEAVAWTRTVTQVWCVFFLINALVAAYTAVFCSLSTWTWYNGFIAYVLMGGLLGGEYLLRRRHQNKAKQI